MDKKQGILVLNETQFTCADSLNIAMIKEFI